jgi:hypothetical protein
MSRKDPPCKQFLSSLYFLFQSRLIEHIRENGSSSDSKYTLILARQSTTTVNSPVSTELH